MPADLDLLLQLMSSQLSPLSFLSGTRSLILQTLNLSLKTRHLKHAAGQQLTYDDYQLRLSAEK